MELNGRNWSEERGLGADLSLCRSCVRLTPISTFEGPQLIVLSLDNPLAFVSEIKCACADTFQSACTSHPRRQSAVTDFEWDRSSMRRLFCPGKSMLHSIQPGTDGDLQTNQCPEYLGVPSQSNASSMYAIISSMPSRSTLTMYLTVWMGSDKFVDSVLHSSAALLPPRLLLTSLTRTLV